MVWTKRHVVKMFEADVLPTLPANDLPAVREAFNVYTDALCKGGEITQYVYDTIELPKRFVRTGR